VEATLDFLRSSFDRVFSDPVTGESLQLIAPTLLTSTDGIEHPAVRMTAWISEGDEPEHLQIGDRAKLTGADGTVDLRTCQVFTDAARVLNTERLVCELEFLSDQTKFRLTDRLEFKGVKFPKDFRNGDDAEALLIARELARLTETVLGELQ
jgi:DNA recombination-dependent growth factor C